MSNGVWCQLQGGVGGHHMDVTKYSPMKKSLMGSNINGFNDDDAFEVSNIIYGNIKSGDSIQ